MNKICLLICLLAILALGACTRPQPVPGMSEYLDDDTGTRVVHLSEPAVYFREVPMLAVHARDYVSLAPMELSQAGQREYLLWVCQWSTVDRVSEPAGDVPGVVLLLDGEPMELQPGRPRSLGRWPYAAPVNGGQTALYSVTRSQLLGLANAREIHVVIESGKAAGEYAPWRSGGEELRLFSRRVSAREPSAVARLDE